MPDVLTEWMAVQDYHASDLEQSIATDPATGRRHYLFRGFRQDGSQAILGFSDGVFEKLETEFDIPIESPWGSITWAGSIRVDAARGTASFIGWDANGRYYILSADFRPMFTGEKLPIKVYYTHPVKDAFFGPSLILPDGRLVMAGGHDVYGTMGNYNPSAAVIAFSPFEETVSAASLRWPWALAGVLVLLAAVAFFLLRKRPAPVPCSPAGREQSAPAETDRNRELYLQLCGVMESEELYARQGLSLADVASRMRTNTKYISSCINSGAGCSFVEFVNGYRIRKAQELLLTHPEMRMNEISDAVGFANESSFYRNFKSVEGCTPQQWLEKRR